MYFNASAAYDRAIREKDKVGLKALLVGIIGSDPTFATTEFDEALKYIKDKSIECHGQGIDVSDKYELQDGEYHTEVWDEAYYKMKLVWLQDNFALEERLQEIIDIGKAVYETKQTMGKSKYSARKNSSRQTVTSTSRNTVRDSNANNRRTTENDFFGERPKTERMIFDDFCIWIKDHWWVVIVAIVIIGGIVYFTYRNIKVR